MNIFRVATFCGSFLLTIVGSLNGRGNFIFLGNIATHLYYTKGGVCSRLELTGGSMTGTIQLTTGGSGNPSALATVSGSTTTKYAIFNTSTCSFVHRIRASNL